MIGDPALTAVTNPVALIVANALLLLLQTPPTVVFVNCVVDPAQTIDVPVIGFTNGNGFIVTVVVTELVQPKAVTA